MRTKLLVPLCLLSLLAACGGGGGDDPAPPPPIVASNSNFPLAAAYRALVQAGGSYNFSLSGTCTGSATQSVAPATTATTFEGSPAVQSSVTQQINVNPGCTPATSASTSTTYHDTTTFLPFGTVTVGSEYVVAPAKPSALPATVKVGDNRVVVSFNVYTSPTKATQRGTRTASYVVTADSATTAIVTVITKDFVNGSLSSTQQTSYRITEAGALTLVSIDSLAGATHLVFTRV